jgi:spore coat polysaccharide biosynthesis protein SpsF
MKPNIGIITQARMTSTRLPGKIMKEINHCTLLQYHTDRLKKTGLGIAIATTTNESDEVICDFAKKNGINYFRGSETNVLSRFYETAGAFGYDIIVRVTSDCPLIDPHLIRNGVEKYIQLNNMNLYMSNTQERTFSRGFDFEIFSFALLKEAYQNATLESDLEHVTPFIWKNKSGKVELYSIKQLQDHSQYRITVDTPEDFELIQQLIGHYHAHDLSYNEIELILSKHPELTRINHHIEQKKV